MAESAPTFRDILDLLSVLRRRAWIVVACAFLCAVIAATVAVSLKPVFRATTQVLIDPSVRQPFENQNAPARYLEDTFVVDSQVTVLQSSSVLRSVVNQLNLIEDPEFGDGAPDQGFLSPLTSLLGGSVQSSPATKEISANKAVETLQGALEVGREGLTFVINVSVDADTPVKAAIISNAIAENYISNQNGQVSRISRTVEEKVGDRLRILRDQLREAEARVEAFRARNNLQSGDQKTLLSDQQLAELSTQLTEQRAALAAADAKASEIRRLIDSGVSIDALSDVTNSATIANLQQQYATAARTQADLATDLLPSHPELIKAKAQTREIRKLLDTEIGRIASTAKLEADVLRDRVAKLEAELDNVRTKSNIDQKSSIELKELQIEADASKQLYENLLSRTKEITEVEQISIPNARIISPAVPPEAAIWPKKKILALAGLVLGAMIGVVIAIGRETASLCVRYLLNPQPELAYAPAAAYAAVSGPDSMAFRAPQIGVLPQQASASISHLPRLPYLGQQADMNADDLLSSLWGFKAGVTDREMRPYWKSVFTILKQIQSNRVDGFASNVIVTSVDGNHNMTALSLVFAAASLKNFRVLLVDNNTAGLQVSRRMLPVNRHDTDLKDAVTAADLDIDFLSLTNGRRKYQSETKGSFQLLNESGLEPEFDLIVISESPMTQPQIEIALRDSADYVIVSVEHPDAFS
ncbi:GumC family protein [Roseibium sp.]|uniref:GumC family protein n=2 Tax=Roseibium sp. TaxID=1936156 RepID=UPI003D120BE1